ncbi:MAG: protein kinase [Catenulispora sp.]|nr:protein kinase [Catenulispora sp.]
MGEVWSARDKVLRREVAVKLLNAHLDSDSAAPLFFREARTASALNHPGVVTVHDLGSDSDGTLFLVMELVHGRNLGQVLQEDGVAPIAQAVEWTAQAADALAAAHRARIVHRDLKPANIMLTDARAVKVLDFGIARQLETGDLTSTQIMGTLAYMPPERFNTGHQDARGDLYALGCVLHELLTGETPFGDLPATGLMYAHVHRIPAPPSTHRPDVPPSLDTLVAELLAKHPDQRPASAQEVRDRLRAIAPASTVQTSTTVPTRVQPKPASPVPAPTRVDVDPVQAGPSAGLARSGMTRRSVLLSGATLAVGGAGTAAWILSSGNAASGQVIAMAARNDGLVYGYDGGSGQRLWTTRITEDSAVTGDFSTTSPLALRPAGRELVYVLAPDGVTGLDRDGRILWHVPASCGSYTPVAVTPSAVVVGLGTELTAISPQGKKLWTVSTSGPVTEVMASATTGEDAVFVNFGFNTNSIQRIDVATGTTAWTHALDTVGGTGENTSPGYIMVFDDGGTYGSSYKYQAISTSDGQARFRIAPNGVTGTAIFAADIAAFVTLEQPTPTSSMPPPKSNTVSVTLRARSAQDGRILWASQTASQSQSSWEPLYANGIAYAVMDNTLYAFKGADGSRLWSRSISAGAGAQFDMTLAGDTIYITVSLSSGVSPTRIFGYRASDGTTVMDFAPADHAASFVVTALFTVVR